MENIDVVELKKLIEKFVIGINIEEDIKSYKYTNYQLDYKKKDNNHPEQVSIVIESNKYYINIDYIDYKEKLQCNYRDLTDENLENNKYKVFESKEYNIDNM